MHRTATRKLRLAASVVFVAATLTCFTSPPVLACGCYHPPAPDPLSLDEDFGINQRAEQIVFEVDDGTVTAHVFIAYAGAPERFAWLLPVPAVPDLGLSPASLFGVLDEMTRPKFQRLTQSACPAPLYQCAGPEYCPGDEPNWGDAGSADTAEPGGVIDPAPVEVLQSEVVGDYQTIVFSAEDAGAAVAWLVDNGFIVNETMTPYMQPYLDMDMLFVAAKLLPGAGSDSVKPLRLTYPSEKPMIPLHLTAVAADPHMMVTTWILADVPYTIEGRPEIEISAVALGYDHDGRLNYPMVMARMVDEAGGDAFVLEAQGPMTPWEPNAESGCCGGSGRVGGVGDGFSGPGECNIANNGQCECPGFDSDKDDCEELAPELVEAQKLIEALAAKHKRMTRLSTRISPEEMTFDPVFAPARLPAVPASQFNVIDYTVQGCVADIVDKSQYDAIQQRIGCTTTYCGPQGTCVPTAKGGSCQCNSDYVAQVFTDVDGQPSVTCVPAQTTVDFSVGLALPDVCAPVDCGQGTCVARNGFPSCECGGGAVASVVDGLAPFCVQASTGVGSPGAENFSLELSDLSICVPAPPSCGVGQWLQPTGASGAIDHPVTSHPHGPRAVLYVTSWNV